MEESQMRMQEQMGEEAQFGGEAPMGMSPDVLSIQDFNSQLDLLLSKLSPGVKSALFIKAKEKIRGNKEICNQIVPQSSFSGSSGSSGKLEFFYIQSKDFGVVQNADDKYSHFYFVQNGMTRQFLNMIHDIGVFKDLRSVYKSTTEGLRQYYYLFHCVFSEAMPVTVLQYACMWNRLDEFKLILSYLIGTSPEYAKKYINYCLPMGGELGGKRAIDLIGVYGDKSLGVRSSAKQAMSYFGNSAKNILNPATLLYDAVSAVGKGVAKTASRVASVSGVTDNPFEALLLQYGSKPKDSGFDAADSALVTRVTKEDQYGPNDPYYAISYPNIKKYKEGESIQNLKGGMTRIRKTRKSNIAKKQRGKTARR